MDNVEIRQLTIKGQVEDESQKPQKVTGKMTLREKEALIRECMDRMKLFLKNQREF